MQIRNATTPNIHTTTKTTTKQHRNTTTLEVQPNGIKTNTAKNKKPKRGNSDGRPKINRRDSRPRVNMLYKRDDGGLAKQKLHQISKHHERKGIRNN